MCFVHSRGASVSGSRVFLGAQPRSATPARASSAPRREHLHETAHRLQGFPPWPGRVEEAELVAPAPSRARRAVTALPTPRICAPGAWRVTYHVLCWAPDASTAELGAPAGPVPSRPLGYDQVAGFDALVVFVLFWGYESRCPITMDRDVPFLFIAAVRWPRTVLAADGAGLLRYP